MQRVTADVILLGQRHKRDARVTGRETDGVYLVGRGRPVGQPLWMRSAVDVRSL